jgi:hypothetical protein
MISGRRKRRTLRSIAIRPFKVAFDQMGKHLVESHPARNKCIDFLNGA